MTGGDRQRLTPTGYRELAGDLKTKFRLGQEGLLTLAYSGVFQSGVDRYDSVALGEYSRWQSDPRHRQLAYGRLQWESDTPWREQIRITGSVQHWRDQREIQSKGDPTRLIHEDQLTTLGLSAELLSRPIASWRIISGVEYYHDRVGSDAYREETETGLRDETDGRLADGACAGSFAVFTTHSLSWGRFGLYGGLRYNLTALRLEDDRFGELRLGPDAWGGNLAVRFELHPQHALTASVNTGFRAPNIHDLSGLGPFDQGLEAPPDDLAPERSLTTELGYKLRSPSLSAGLSVYQTELRGLIARQQGSYQGQPVFEGLDVYQQANAADAVVRGVEAEAEYLLGQRLSLFGNLTYTYGQNTGDDEPLPLIPPLYGRLALNFRPQFSGLFARLEYLYAGNQSRPAPGEEENPVIPPGDTPGWSVFNLQAGYRRGSIHLQAGLDNLLNEGYRPHGSGVGGVGRSFWISLYLEL